MLVNLLLGKRDLSGPNEIVDFIKKSKEFDSNSEHADTTGALLLFRTSRQQTWLVATSERLYCVLDDVREPKPELKWVMSKDELVSNGDVIVPISVHEYSRNSGRVDVGAHKSWLFSKALFSAMSIEESITTLIRRQMIDWQARAYA